MHMAHAGWEAARAGWEQTETRFYTYIKDKRRVRWDLIDISEKELVNNQ